MDEKPLACQGCTDGASPIYKFELRLKCKGWTNTSRVIWLCAICQHKLAFEDSFLWQP